MKHFTALFMACLLTLTMLVPGMVYAEENDEMILLEEEEDMIVLEETEEIPAAEAEDGMSFRGAKKIDNGDSNTNYLITMNVGDLLVIDGNVLLNGNEMEPNQYYWVGGLILAKKDKNGHYEMDLDGSSSSIATFDNYNPLTVKAIGPGTVYLGLQSREKYGLNLWIEVKEAQTVECTKITLNKKTAEIATGSSLKLRATLEPKNVTDKTITWKSSNAKVASVDSTGKVTAKKYGTATITATSANGKKATCKIQTRFKDVNNPSKSYYKAVYWAVDNGITKCSVTFNPEGGVTRGEFVAFLYRMSGSPEVKESATNFTDVESGTKFYDEISWAVSKGIIKGFSDKTFRPNDGVTRAQAAIMLWRWSGKPSIKATTSPFTDVKYAKSDTATAVIWGNENGIINGFSDGTFRPAEKCTRANVVTFLYRTTLK